MYDHNSPFKTTPSAPLPLSISRTACDHAHDHNHNHDNDDEDNSHPSREPHQPSLPSTSTTTILNANPTTNAAAATATPRRLSASTLRNLHRHAAAHFARQSRERTPTWLSEAQMLRQLKRVVWKVQTREEWLVVELNVVRSAVREMVRGVEESGSGVGGYDDDVEETGGGHRSERGKGRDRGKGRKWTGGLGCVTEENEVGGEVWLRDNREMRDAGRRYLVRWQGFVDNVFVTACEDVLYCRRGIELAEAYEVLDKIVSICATADDRRWFEDLASLGEQAGFGGLKILDPRVKAVVWAIAEVYQTFKAEQQRMKRKATSSGAGGWIAALVEAGACLEECGLVDNVDPAWKEGGDADVLSSLCVSFERMSLDGHEEEEVAVRKQAKRGDLKSKVERLWQEAFGCLGTGFCASS